MRLPLLVIALASCGAPAAPPVPPAAPKPEPAARHTEPATHPDATVAELEALVVAGVPAAFNDACYSGPVWGALNRVEGGERLDTALAVITSKATPSSRESVCDETIAIARLLRLVRTNTLDLGAELGHSSGAVREVAARYAVTVGVDEAAATQLRVLVDDPDLGISNEALRAIEAHHDVAAIPVLQNRAKVHSSPDGIVCSTLRSLGDTRTCRPPSKKKDTGPLISVTSTGKPVDYCAEARANLSSADRNQQVAGMLFFVSEEFEISGRKWMSLANMLDDKYCTLTPDERTRQLRASDPEVRGLAAAVELWVRARAT